MWLVHLLQEKFPSDLQDTFFPVHLLRHLQNQDIFQLQEHQNHLFHHLIPVHILLFLQVQG